MSGAADSWQGWRAGAQARILIRSGRTMTGEQRQITTLERAELIELVQQWICARVEGAEQTVPESLEATVTRRKPWRAATLDDARYFLALPRLYGIGMQILIRTELFSAPFADWPASVAPLDFRVEWKRDMPGTAFDSFDGSFARVGLEDGCWRLVTIWEEPEREQNRESITHALPKHILKPSAPRGIGRLLAALRRLWAR